MPRTHLRTGHLHLQLQHNFLRIRHISDPRAQLFSHLQTQPNGRIPSSPPLVMASFDL